jgi:hypothetical protein
MGFTIEPTFFWFRRFHYEVCLDPSGQARYLAELTYPTHPGLQEVTDRRQGKLQRARFEKLWNRIHALPLESLHASEASVLTDQPFYTLTLVGGGKSEFSDRVYGLPNSTWRDV